MRDLRRPASLPFPPLSRLSEAPFSRMNRPQGPLPCSATALYLTPRCHPPALLTLPSTSRQGVNFPTRWSKGWATKQLVPQQTTVWVRPLKTVSPLNVRVKGVPCKARKLSSNEKKQKGGIRGRISRLEQKTKSCDSSVPPLTSVTFPSVPTTLTPLHCSVDRLKSSVSVLSPCC